MAEYINRQTILDDLDIDIQVTNMRRLSAKEKHCDEDRMRYAEKLNRLRGFRNYIKSLPTADVVEHSKIDNAIEEIHLYKHENGDEFDRGMMKALSIFIKNIDGIGE